ncbi:MAG: penicillin-binding protein [Solirubrobacteraceae bacterium]|jgi:penicillin-binding protein 1A|nr:penicillin-binding protein [Solirubrobacteraceae bacterium]
MFGVLVAFASIGVLGAVGYVVSIANDAPDLSTIKPKDQGANSVVYAADGKTRLGFITSDVLRSPVPSTSIPQSMKDATVAIEDSRFYKHKGVDFEGVIRAAFKNLQSNGDVQGGSTLTMQLIRNLYTGDRRRTFSRKIKEAKLAEDLENIHPGLRGKRWILTKYLNNVPYGTVGGQTAYGIQAAARVFFDKPASDLTLPESALLAGLPQAPTLDNPFLNPQRALSRRNEVLRKMADQGYITQSEADIAIASKLGAKKTSYYRTHREGYFFDYVKQELIKTYGPELVRRGGLRVYTTINLKWQKLARAAIAGRLNQPGDPSAALVSIDPRNGHILAMASSASYGNSKFNLAAQSHRQPGSTFKVMTLMTALRRGVNPLTTTYVSKPLKFFDKETGTQIDVQTDDHRYVGRTNLFEALVRSDNTVYQQLDLDMGPTNVTKTAHDMGITSHLDSYPAEGLGGLKRGVSPLEMANAYATIASGGMRNRAVGITKVVMASGKVDTTHWKPKRTKVFTDGQTYEAIKAMEANAQRGTGTASQFGCSSVAGKTGTTTSFTDAWFDGMVPGLATAVWVGYPKTTTSMTSVHGIEVFGGTFPAQIWHDFMQQVVKKCDPWPQPKVPFVSQPFFGRYSSTGAPGGGVDTSTVPQGAPSPQTTTPQNGTGVGTTPSGGQSYPPDQYASPPQQAPPGQTPPAGQGGGTGAPPAGNGTG